jgi:hypothetical protein
MPTVQGPALARFADRPRATTMVVHSFDGAVCPAVGSAAIRGVPQACVDVTDHSGGSAL